MNLINKWAMSGAVGCLLLAVPLATYYVVKRKLKGKSLYASRLEARAFPGKGMWLADMTAVNSGNACACCGGENTRLLPIANDEWQCADRKLCRETMIYTHMLKGLESA